MALTKTARLELINPYQKYGLKRRPTFDEIVGLVSENDKLMRPFPNREATRFRNSPQGSFFDGSDSLDVLKEQQTRILDRQMREAIMRREAQQNGGTLHLMKHQEQQTSGLSTPLTSESGYETPSSATSSIYHASFARHMEERLRQEAERQQEVRNKHREGLNKLNQTMMHGMMRRGLRGLQEYEDEPPPLEPIPTDDTEEELIPAEETIRPYQKNVVYLNNDIERMRNDTKLTYEDILFQLHIRGRLTDDMYKRVDELPDEISKKIYLLTIIENLIGDGTAENEWQTTVEENLLKSRIKQWREMRGKFIKPSEQQASSSSGGKSFSQSVAEGAKEGAKQVAKAAAIKGGEMLFKRAIGI